MWCDVITLWLRFSKYRRVVQLPTFTKHTRLPFLNGSKPSFTSNFHLRNFQAANLLGDRNVKALRTSGISDCSIDLGSGPGILESRFIPLSFAKANGIWKTHGCFPRHLVPWKSSGPQNRIFFFWLKAINKIYRYIHIKLRCSFLWVMDPFEPLKNGWFYLTTWHHIQRIRQSSCRCDVDMGQTRSCCTGGVGWGHGRSWMRPPGCYNHEINGQTYITGQMIATSHDLTWKDWKGSWGREMGPLISGESRLVTYYNLARYMGKWGEISHPYNLEGCVLNLNIFTASTMVNCR